MPTPGQVAAKRGEPIETLPDVSPALMSVLLLGLSDDPADRPSAAAFRDRLTAAAREASSGIDESGAVAAPVPVSRGRDRTWVVLLGVGVILLGFVAAWLVADRTPDSGAATSGRTAAPASSSASAASPTPTPTPIQAGFVDCSDQVGAAALCRSSRSAGRECSPTWTRRTS